MSDGPGMITATTPQSDVVPTAATPDGRMAVAKAVALFCFLGAGAYAAADVPPSPAADTFFSMAPPIGVILWLERDAHRTGVGAAYDMGFLLWPSYTRLPFIPWYALKTRGRAGWRLLLLLFLLTGASDVGELLGTLLVVGRR